jgi:hypothetical protein
MNHDHDAVRLHRAELDAEIDTIREERLLASGRDDRSRSGFVDLARQRTGRALIAAGTALVDGESRSFGFRRV